MVVYADILFLINFSMDFLILFGVGRLCKLKCRPLRLCISAALGGIYSILALMITNGVLSIVSAVCISFPMCLIAYKRQRAKNYFKTVFLFYSGSVLLGGAVSACYTVIDSFSPDIPASGVMTDIPLGVFAVIAAVSVILSFVSGKLWSKEKSCETVTAQLFYNGECVTLKLLCDTGNLLTEPISGLPAVVASKSSLLSVLESDFPCENSKNLRLIPIKTASGSKLLYGFMPDKFIIHNKDRTAVAECAVAVADENGFSDCDGVLPVQLL